MQSQYWVGVLTRLRHVTHGYGYKVVKRYSVYGVHKGEFAGIPPTYKEVNITGFSLLRIDSGKIAEQWSLDDLFSFFQQIGVLSS